MTTKKNPASEELEDVKTTSEVVKEVAAESADETEFPKFTVEVNGEGIEVEDRFREGATPAALMMASKYPEKYALAAIEALLGQDQVEKLILAGATSEELGDAITAWAEHRGIEKK